MAHKIAAVSTGWVRSGIGIVRMSGDGCIEAAARLFAADNKKPLPAQKDRAMALGTLCDESGRTLDRALAVISRAPHSYTGEDTCEFHCHGSPALLAAVLRALFSLDFRQAEKGEFTKRAFLNGQMDLTQAEAVIDLIDAATAEAACNAAGQVGGAMQRKIEPLYTALCDVCAHFHAVLDYPDEDIAPFELENFRTVLTDVQKELSALLGTCERGRRLKNGVRAVILGAPNAGKSSLLNALCGYERVIVTEIAGTTRDAVEESVTLGRHLLRLLDTAGIRETDDRIEKLGVERAELAAKEADLAIFVVDASTPLTEEDVRAMQAAKRCPRAIALLNKTDLPPVLCEKDLPFDTVLSVCAKEGSGLDGIETALDRLFPDESPCDGTVLTNARQSDALRRAAESLDAVLGSMALGMTPDAVLVDVEEAMSALGEVTGRTVREDITNRIFDRFCVGK